MFTILLVLLIAASLNWISQVLECDEFYGLGPEQVASLIASDTITVPNEEKVKEFEIIFDISYDVSFTQFPRLNMGLCV